MVYPWNQDKMPYFKIMVYERALQSYPLTENDDGADADDEDERVWITELWKSPIITKRWSTRD